MNTTNYKGFTIRKTDTTTTIKRLVPGTDYRFYDAIVNLYEIEDLKAVGRTPFICSIRAAKDYINDYLESQQLSEVEIPPLTDEEWQAINEIYDYESN